MKKKFSDSFNGLKLALNHKAVLVQLILGLLAIIGGLIIKLDHYEWLAFVVCTTCLIMPENDFTEACNLYFGEDPADGVFRWMLHYPE